MKLKVAWKLDEMRSTLEKSTHEQNVSRSFKSQIQ